jgi:RNA polymerase sigma-70 factor (ECF subfamily)
MTDRGQEIRWVVRAQAGDWEALNALLKETQEPLYRYVARLIGDDQLARDVLQDVFVLIVRKLGWLREPSLFRPWAYRIASRRAFQCLRTERRRTGCTEDSSILESLAGEPPEVNADPEVLERLPELLKEVSPASRAVLTLHYLEEMTLREVADVLEISLSAAKSRLAYGLATLRKRLGACPK